MTLQAVKSYTIAQLPAINNTDALSLLSMSTALSYPLPVGETRTGPILM